MDIDHVEYSGEEYQVEVNFVSQQLGLGGEDPEDVDMTGKGGGTGKSSEKGGEEGSGKDSIPPALASALHALTQMGWIPSLGKVSYAGRAQGGKGAGVKISGSDVAWYKTKPGPIVRNCPKHSGGRSEGVL